jgi:hypothetical protein
VVPRGAPSAVDRAIDGLGELWVQGVDHEPSVEAGIAAIARIRATLGPDSAQDRLLQAYEGAFLALRAKHGTWPVARVRNLRAGFDLMDEAVAEAPRAADIRYLRLMSGFYLPGILGRGDEVDQDLSALVRLLPESRQQFPAAAFPAIVEFVLEHGDPEPDQQRELEALLP